MNLLPQDVIKTINYVNGSEVWRTLLQALRVTFIFEDEYYCFTENHKDYDLRVRIKKDEDDPRYFKYKFTCEVDLEGTGLDSIVNRMVCLNKRDYYHLSTDDIFYQVAYEIRNIRMSKFD